VKTSCQTLMELLKLSVECRPTSKTNTSFPHAISLNRRRWPPIFISISISRPRMNWLTNHTLMYDKKVMKRRINWNASSWWFLFNRPFHGLLFSFASQYNLACMWGNFGLFCSRLAVEPTTLSVLNEFEGLLFGRIKNISWFGLSVVGLYGRILTSVVSAELAAFGTTDLNYTTDLPLDL